MVQKYEKEYLRYIFSLNLWIKRTKENIKLLPEIEKLSKLTYDEWFEQNKNKLK